MKFYIWSFEHNSWWKPNAHGYTKELINAGKYELDEAIRICENANRPYKLNEAMIPEMGEDNK